jgi:hypothetical protein
MTGAEDGFFIEAVPRRVEERSLMIASNITQKSIALTPGESGRRFGLEDPVPVSGAIFLSFLTPPVNASRASSFFTGGCSDD